MTLVTFLRLFRYKPGDKIHKGTLAVLPYTQASLYGAHNETVSFSDKFFRLHSVGKPP